MSVQKQFKRQGERMTAAFLWSIIFGLLFTKIGRRILLVLIIIGVIICVIPGEKDGPYKGYIHGKNVSFYNQPEGKVICKLLRNDTLTVFGGEMIGQWQKVLIKGDTLFTDKHAYIENRPFSKWDGLGFLSHGAKPKHDLLRVNSKNGYILENDQTVKNGTKLVYYSLENDSTIEVRKTSSFNNGTSFSVPIKDVKINWDYVKKKYPRAIY